jgi:hypothetical protein
VQPQEEVVQLRAALNIIKKIIETVEAQIDNTPEA